MLTDINIYLINNKIDHILEKSIFYIKKSKTKVDIFPIWIWIRIHIKMKRICNTADSKNQPKSWKISTKINQNMNISQYIYIFFNGPAMNVLTPPPLSLA